MNIHDSLKKQKDRTSNFANPGTLAPLKNLDPGSEDWTLVPGVVLSNQGLSCPLLHVSTPAQQLHDL